jgi:hypothetical protein
MTRALVRLTRHGIVTRRELVPFYGVIGSIAWAYDGNRVKLVRFTLSRRVCLRAGIDPDEVAP